MSACRGFGWKRPGLPLAVNYKNRAWKGARTPEMCRFPARARFHVRIGFSFWGHEDDASRQIWTPDHRPADLRHRPLKLPLRLLPFRRPGKLPRARSDSFLGRTRAPGADFCELGHPEDAHHRRRTAGARWRG